MKFLNGFDTYFWIWCINIILEGKDEEDFCTGGPLRYWIGSGYVLLSLFRIMSNRGEGTFG